LVDGRYIHEKRNVDLKFRGSENQRIIHLKDGEIDIIE
jgi:anaerobic ribonucleoside-triphosphate reductase activating protein